LDALEAIHNRGVIIGDLSMNNVIVDPDTWSVKLIDFESAIRLGHDEHLMGMFSGWTTPGYLRPGRLRSGLVRLEDDYYAVSRVLRGALLPSAALSELNPECHVAFLQFLEELDVPSWPVDVVEATEIGDFVAARAALPGS
jgi:serine/threonine protein kinase